MSRGTGKQTLSGSILVTQKSGSEPVRGQGNDWNRKAIVRETGEATMERKEATGKKNDQEANDRNRKAAIGEPGEAIAREERDERVD